MRQEPEYLPETAAQSSKDAAEMPGLVAQLAGERTQYVCPVCGPQSKPCNEIAADYNKAIGSQGERKRHKTFHEKMTKAKADKALVLTSAKEYEQLVDQRDDLLRGCQAALAYLGDPPSAFRENRLEAIRIIREAVRKATDPLSHSIEKALPTREAF